MNIEDIEQLEKELIAQKKRAEELIDYFKEIEKIPIENAIANVGDSIDFGAEKLLPILKHRKLKHWNTRAIPIEAVNAILTDFEFGVMEIFTNNAKSILLSQIYKSFALPIWLLSNKKLLYSIAADLEKRISKIMRENLPYVNPALWVMILFDEAAREGLTQEIKEQAASLKMWAEIVTGIFATVMIVEMVKAGVAAWEAVKSGKEFGLLNELVKRQIAEIERRSFPQSKPRYRREKRQRMRAKR